MIDKQKIRDIFVSALGSEGIQLDSFFLNISPYKDFKILWKRSNKYLQLNVSDYAFYMTDDVFRGVARSVVRRIYSVDDGDHPEDVRRFFLENDWTAARKLWLQRYGGIDALLGTQDGVMLFGSKCCANDGFVVAKSAMFNAVILAGDSVSSIGAPVMEAVAAVNEGREMWSA